jgi:hypothetical protein
VDFTDPDPGQTHTISWYIEAASATGPTDPADLLPFNWAPKSVGDYKIWVRVNDGFATTTGGPYDISRVNISGWARTWGSGLDDEGWQLAVDNQGNAYVMGYFSSTIDFDPDPGQTDLKTAVGPYWRDYYLCKYDATGDYKWARTWGGPSTQTYGGVCVDDLGSVYAAGQFGYPNIDFDPDPATSDVHSPVGGSDIFLSKFDTDGNYKWVRCWGGTGDDWLNHAVADVSGNVFVTGWYGSVGADFDPGSGTAILSSNGGYDPWLSKFDSSGNLQWAKGWGGLGMDLGTGNAIDSSGNVYSVGTYAGTVDFDPGAGVDNHTANGGQDAYVLKLNSSGTFQWARTWGAGGSSNNYDQVQGASADNAGFVYVCGIFQGIDADFDPGSGVDNHSSNGAFDDFLSKFDSSGTFQWALTWGGSLDENAYSCAYDGVGNVYVTGHFMSANVDFDPGAGTDNHSSISSADWFLSKLDSSGTFQWARTWGNTTVPWGSDFGFDIACRYPGAVYVIGLFSGTIDLDPGSGADLHTSYGAQDACLMKVLSNGYWQ